MQEQTREDIRLDAEELAITRGDRALFEDLSFSLEPGHLLQVEGANGSGKTTLLRILSGLTRPAAGCVRWCGRPVERDLPAYFSDLSYVGHLPGVKEELTPLENLAFSHALGRARAAVTAEAALERVGLPEVCEEVPCRKLSAGQRRRVALARLLMTDARLWILDEPFTALDKGGRRMVEGLLAEHVAAGGMAVITTHHAMDLGESTVQHLYL